jgi:hypothetical protein
MGCGIRPAPLTMANVSQLLGNICENRLCHNVLDVRCGLAQMAQHTALDLAKGNDARELTDPCNRIQRGVVGTIRSEQEPQSLDHGWSSWIRSSRSITTHYATAESTRPARSGPGWCRLV